MRQVCEASVQVWGTKEAKLTACLSHQGSLVRGVRLSLPSPLDISPPRWGSQGQESPGGRWKPGHPHPPRFLNPQVTSQRHEVQRWRSQ